MPDPTHDPKVADLAAYRRRLEAEAALTGEPAVREWWQYLKWVLGGQDVPRGTLAGKDGPHWVAEPGGPLRPDIARR